MVLLDESDPSWEGPATHAPQRGGKHRRSRARSLLELFALLVAVVGVVRLVTLPSPARPRPAPAATPSALPTLAETWPGAAPVGQPGRLTDGTPFTPQLYLDATRSVGTAPTRDGSAVRVLLRDAAGVRELRRVDADQFPQFLGFTVSGDDVVWAESTSPGNEAVRTRLYRVNWTTGARPALITSDTGDVSFGESQYDIVVNNGKIHWVSAESGRGTVTQVRSVSLGGGGVSYTRVTGAYTLSAWPWLVKQGSADASPVELVDVVSDKRVKLATTPQEVARCSPTWCRVVVLGGDAVPIRIDLQHPDGTQRRPIAGADANAVVADVALLDRFEPLGVAGPPDSVGRTLVLYDIAADRIVTVASEVDIIRARQGVLWWSTGTGTDLVWHSLDLRTLT